MAAPEPGYPVEPWKAPKPRREGRVFALAAVIGIMTLWISAWITVPLTMALVAGHVWLHARLYRCPRCQARLHWRYEPARAITSGQPIGRTVFDCHPCRITWNPGWSATDQGPHG